MNATEARLTDALRATGETIGPEDVPALELTARRPFRAGRPILAVALVAATVAGSVGVAGLLSDDPAPPRTTSPLAQPGRQNEVVIFLCTKSSGNPTCRGTDASARERAELKKALTARPGVLKVEYESRGTTFKRFQDRFSRDPKLVRAIRVRDLPDAFLVTARGPEEAKGVWASMLGRPGVDQVIIGKR